MHMMQRKIPRERERGSGGGTVCFVARQVPPRLAGAHHVVTPPLPPSGPSDDPDQTDLKSALLSNPGSNQLSHSLQQRAVYTRAVSVSAGKAFFAFLKAGAV